jgi:predicted nucleic acid-binding protein
MIPLFSQEATSEAISDLLREDREIAVWWGTWAECTVAISRLVRENKLNEDDEATARFALGLFALNWTEVNPTDNTRSLIEVLSLNHALKSADTLQLAAALRWCEGDTASAGFVCLDGRLRRAAREEGFDVLPETSKTA